MTGHPGTDHRGALVQGGGEAVEGVIRYIAPSADPATRTFRLELALANPAGRLRDGVTSEIEIVLDEVRAHRFSPAILALSDRGEVGVRIVDAEGLVDFVPVEIIGEERDAVWVAGLPDTVTVITVGQDYVSDGQRVEPVLETAEATP